MVTCAVFLLVLQYSFTIGAIWLYVSADRNFEIGTIGVHHAISIEHPFPFVRRSLNRLLRLLSEEPLRSYAIPA